MKNFKKSSMLLFFAITALNVSGQEVVSTQGESYANTNGSISFTIGEVVINTASDGSNDLTQGFHQTNWNFLGVLDHTPDYEASIFPNPTAESLNIKTTHFENVSYSLFDGQGKLVLQNKLTATITSIEVGQLAPGSYTVALSEDATPLKTFKLIKTQ